MKNPNEDIYEMLDTLSLPVAAQRFMELSKSPELCNYTAMQFIREVLEPQYTDEYYGSNVPLFRRNGYRQSGTMIP